MRLIGCLLILGGCLGFAGSICGDWNRRLALLKQLRGIYENMKYYITYQKAAVPEALWGIAEKEREPFASAFREICRGIYEEGENFPRLWMRQMEKVAEESPLKEQEKKLIYDFPSCLGYMEENAQALALDELLREIRLHIEELETERKSRNKLIMTLGAAGGCLLALLLL